MELSEVSGFVDRCIYDAPAPCSCSCPFGLDIRSFLKKVAKGRLPAAYRELRTATVFPTVAAALCTRPCMARCQRALLGDEPLDMAGLEAAVLRLTEPQPPDVFQIPVKPQRVAVIGAGAAGLALALSMAQKKYPVTVFEETDSLGGSLRAHPDFETFRADIAHQFSCEQVDFRFNAPVSDLSQLEDYAILYVATGADGADFGLKAGWDQTLFTTHRPGVFLGGGLVGMGTLEAMAAAGELSRLMEGVIQTGRAQGGQPKPVCPEHRLIPPDAVPAPRVLPQSPEGYTKAEAREEAARCFQCACEHCLKGCELLKKYRKPPHQMAMEILADSGPHFLASRTMTREVYSCNQCGWCGSTCPEQVDLGSLFHLSRAARAEGGIQPAAFHDFWLNQLDFVSTEGFLATPPAGKETCDYAFFPGCQLTAVLPEQTLAAQALLEERFGAGVLLGCCGASAWWAGEQSLWAENAARLTGAWERLGKPTLVLACATCAGMLARVSPEITTVSLYALLAQQEDLTATALFPEAAVFDPCAARDDEQTRQSVRAVLTRSGAAVEDANPTGKCCGWGGHMRTASPELYEEIAGQRASARELPYYVYCANCREVFREQGKPCRHVLEALFGESDRSCFLHEKRQNHLKVKGRLMSAMEHKEFQPQTHPWDGVKLVVDDRVRREMEEALISDEDVRECIWASLREEGRFRDDQGVYLASLQRKVMTYWVEYAENPDSYEVRAAYCHRMRFGGEEAE